MSKRVFFLLMTFAAASAHALVAPRTDDVSVRLGGQGDILAWLVSGPFPNVGALERRGTGFARDYLANAGGEAQAAAVEGAPIPPIREERETDPALRNPRRPGWRLAVGTTKGGLDLAALLDGSKPAIAYCYTELVSAHDRDVTLLFGSDDGAKVYLNGDLLFHKQIARGVKRDEDRVPLHLHAGVNRLLFKIEQGDGGWGLMARLVDPNGAPTGGVVERIAISPAGDRREPLAVARLRQMRGEPGALDVESAQAYAAILDRADLWVRRFRAEAEAPERLEAAIRNARQSVSASEGDADRLSAALAVGARTIQRAYDRSRAPLVRAVQNPRPLVATKVAREDYLRTMPGGHYFVHADGKPFVPIGYNHNPDWPEFEPANPLAPNYDPERVDRYFAHLHDMGVNLVRLMVETPPTGNLEDAVGTISPEHVRWLDRIFLNARRQGIKLMVTPYDTFWMNLRADASPYWAENGGPIRNKIDFYTKPELLRAQERRMRFLIDRYGNTGDVFCWEIMNEADLWWGANAQQLATWSHAMARYVRDYERRKWGRNHMVTMSAAASEPKGAMATLFYRSPDFDFATTHLYIGASRAPTEPLEPALNAAEGVRYALSQIRDDRPYLDGENGPIDRWIASAALDDAVFHNMIWAHLAAGGAGSGLRWPYRNPHHLTEGMLASLRAMRTFADAVDWAAMAGARQPVTVSARVSAGIGSAKAALVWAAEAAETLRVDWAGGRFRYRIFDTLTGKWVGEGVTEDGNIKIPSMTTNPAIWFARR